jgi:hypothetical protein
LGIARRAHRRRHADCADGSAEQGRGCLSARAEAGRGVGSDRPIGDLGRRLRRRQSHRGDAAVGGNNVSGNGAGLSADVDEQNSACVSIAHPRWSGRTVTLHARAAWAHDWISDPAMLANFQALAGTNFPVTGGGPAHDAALLSADATMEIAKGMTRATKLGGAFAARASSYDGKAELRMTDLIGAPDRSRTCDLCLRRAALYPAELRVRNGPQPVGCRSSS